MPAVDYNRLAHGSNHNFSVKESSIGTTTFESITKPYVKGETILHNDINASFMNPRVMQHSQDMSIMYHQ